jgi:hypothetical protein
MYNVLNHSLIRHAIPILSIDPKIAQLPEIYTSHNTYDRRIDITYKRTGIQVVERPKLSQITEVPNLQQCRLRVKELRLQHR